MKYEVVDLDAFTLAGTTLRTNNSAEGLAKIQQHWSDFHKQGIPQMLGMADDSPVYEAYFDFESDANGAYTLLLGNREATAAAPGNDELLARSAPAAPYAKLHVSGPNEVLRRNFPAARYAKFHVSGPNEIGAAWQHIWQRTDIDRSFVCDFERIETDRVDIYVSVKT